MRLYEIQRISDPSRKIKRFILLDYLTITFRLNRRINSYNQLLYLLAVLIRLAIIAIVIDSTLSDWMNSIWFPNSFSYVQTTVLTQQFKSIEKRS